MRRTVGALLRKELLVELRTLESVPGMSLFAVTTFVVFHFALQPQQRRRRSRRGDPVGDAAVRGDARRSTACSSPTPSRAASTASCSRPSSAAALLLAKALALLAYLVVLELVAVPAFALLLLGPSLGQALPDLLGVLALGDLGVAAIGTLVAALAVRTRARDLLGPLLALPLLVPIVIGGARATLAAARARPCRRARRGAGC